MLLQFIAFASVILVALALAPAMAHLLEMRSKLKLSRDDYQTVQKIYRGWSRLGIVVVAALMTTLLLTYLVRDDPTQLVLVGMGFACIAATQGVFWLWTFPINKATSDWTRLADDWQTLRRRWEYSHAASAALNLAALLCLAAMLALQIAPRQQL